MDKFCFLASEDRTKGWIVETKNVYTVTEGDKSTPITLDESFDAKVYVRNVGVPLNNLLVIGSDDDPKVLKERHDDGIIRIRTMKFNDYSPSIQSKQSSKPIQPASKPPLTTAAAKKRKQQLKRWHEPHHPSRYGDDIAEKRAIRLSVYQGEVTKSSTLIGGRDTNGVSTGP
ncbi:hypothetical protein KQX54_013142 [Cotesia glomerata]|uniref:Uncharacterized protein n=1 Tax=Cotesia glomerata TaxID=32391 RepID=A0AAV7IF35_COTGL|nr:hypothetical protein KQX54_013142 [Cotesia glomerata]